MKTLGLDLGTNSIGWALIESNGQSATLVKKGVQIFEKGVGEGKSGEFSRASVRTQHRAARRLKQRRTWRKQETLKALIDHGMCPGLTIEEVDEWNRKKTFPQNPLFRKWLQTVEVTADGKPAGPYYYRWMAATSDLDLAKSENRFRLGRAFYHIAQRRGYKSNRVSGEDIDSTVSGSIRKLDEAMAGRTLGQYYYEDCLGKEPVRGIGHYTSREHYQAEFNHICERQKLSEETRNSLQRAIFFQRPLKSQKGSVGRCPLEPRKHRCPISHPEFERFRALQTVNNILLTPPGESEARTLTSEERSAALEWMMGLSKAEHFEKLAKKLLPKRAAIRYGREIGGENSQVWVFNYRDDMAIAPCPVSARFRTLFGKEWKAEIQQRFYRNRNKTAEQIINDIWHALFYIDSHEELMAYGVKSLGLSEAEATVFAKPIPQGYANLSICAVRKIVPYLEKGIIYSHAVFMANIPTMYAAHGDDWILKEAEIQNAIERILNTHRLDTCTAKALNTRLAAYKEDGTNPHELRATIESWGRLKHLLEEAIISEYGRSQWELLDPDKRTAHVDQAADTLACLGKSGKSGTVQTIHERIKDLLVTSYNIPEEGAGKLYHPSAIETYPLVQPDNDGRLKLASPRIESIKNPVFMRTMMRVRHLINSLLRDGVIDRQTRIHLEMARDLNTANARNAIYREQREREKQNSEYRAAIEEAGFAPTDSNVLKYRLWIEQNKKCLYTNKEIGLTEFLGDNPVYDIEHTLPRSLVLDNSQSNLTLCERRFNREVKRNRIPSQLRDAEVIADRARALWASKVEELEVLMVKRRNAGRSAMNKEAKDKALAEYHYFQGQLRYWREKLRRFEMTEISKGFTNSQLVDTRIICKYAREYLKSLFERVYSVRAQAVAGVKDIWGLDEKFRGHHIHHCIDAVITACMRPAFYDQLASYYHEHEKYERAEAAPPKAPEPWPGFARDMNEKMKDEVLCVHVYKDNLLKQTVKILRKRGHIQRNSKGEPIVLKGSSARGQLHKDSIYGQIELPPKAGGCSKPERVCVIRKRLDKDFKEFDVIIDPAVRKLVEEQKDKLKTGETIWFDEGRGIPIKSVRIQVGAKPESAIPVGVHRDESKHDYKRHKYAANAGNFITAVYRGTVKGKPKAKSNVISNYEAVQATRLELWDTVLPKTTPEGLTLKHVLKTGSKVLFYEHDPEELRNLSLAELTRRLYHVTVMEEARVHFVHHACGIPDKDLGKGVSKTDWSGSPPPKLRLSTSKLQILVEGEDFLLTLAGDIEWRG